MAGLKFGAAILILQGNIKLADVIESGEYELFYSRMDAVLTEMGWDGQPVYIGGTGGVRKLRDAGGEGLDQIDRFTRDVRDGGKLGKRAEFHVLEGVDE